jgi:hypothetical protein
MPGTQFIDKFLFGKKVTDTILPRGKRAGGAGDMGRTLPQEYSSDFPGGPLLYQTGPPGRF